MSETPPSKEVKSNTLGEIGKYLAENGLPAVIAGPAGTAISRLIGSTADIPTTYLERFSQRVRSRNESEKIVSNAIAHAAAAKASEDLDILDRATHRWVGAEVRKQMNREAIAQKTIPQLDSALSDTDAPETPNDDWMNHFESYAEKASTEKMQNLWARILAGEIRKAGSYSLRTLSLMATLDQESASAIEISFPFVVGGLNIPNSEELNKEIGFENLMVAEDLGVLSGVGGFLSYELRSVSVIDGKRAFVLHDGDYALCGFINEQSKQKTLSVPAYPLSDVGRQVYKLISPQQNKLRHKVVADIWRKNRTVEHVKLYKKRHTGTGRIDFYGGSDI